MGGGGTVSHILDLGTRKRCVVSFTTQPLYSQYPLERRLGGPQNQSRYGAEEKNSHLLPYVHSKL